ncbi:hypothetical protein [Lactococcus petauri]|uniref:hypothetical protein n=1 Tax=Lactococcus petauri TaxID=1940789 RepID=UPI003854FD36
MTQYSFPWNDVNGDRLYDADDFMRFFAAFLKTGVVMSFKDGLRVRSAQNGMNIFKLGEVLLLLEEVRT